MSLLCQSWISQRACQNHVSWCPSNLLNPLVMWETGDVCVEECRNQNRQLSRVETTNATLQMEALNTYEGPGNQCSSVRSE